MASCDHPFIELASGVSIKRRLDLLVALCVSFIACSLSASSAFAALTYVPDGQIPPANASPSSFSFILAESTAVDDANGHIYVADSGRGEVFDFNSATDTSPAVWNGSKTPLGSFGGGHLSVAVDNSTGDVYVADRENAVIDKFEPNGELVASFGDTSPSSNGQLAGIGTPAGSFAPAAEYYSSFGIAVDQKTNDLYVVDAGHEVVDVFNEDGSYQRQITATPPGLYGPSYWPGAYATGIAVNSNSGSVYVADWSSQDVYEFDASGNYISTWDGNLLPNGEASQTPTGSFGNPYSTPIAVATDDSSGNVFVLSWRDATVDIFDPEGNFLPPQLSNSELGGSSLFTSEGVAVDQASHSLYVSSNATGTVQVFKAIVVPDIALSSPTSLTATTATLNGHIDPAGAGEVTGCRFEYGTTTAYGQSVPCAEGNSFTAPADVHADIHGLSPGSEYHYRLLASNADGRNFTVGTFSTVARYAFSGDIGSSGSGAGQLLNPEDVAVDESSGDIYVADTGNHRIVKFDPSGQFLASWGWGVNDGSASSEVCTSGCQAGIAGTGPGQFTMPSFLEVDNSHGPSAGDVYVADTANNVVQKFDPSGQLVTTWGSNGATTYSEGIAGIAVESNGHLVVQPGSGQGIDVDAFGAVFGGPVAINRSTGARYFDTGGEVQTFTSGNSLLEAFGAGYLNSAQGLAFVPATDLIYVANSGANDVAQFTQRALPEVTTGPAASVTQTSAAVTGHVDPGAAGSVRACYFEYGTNTNYSLGTVQCTPAAPISTSTEVSANLTGLTAFTTYHYRLVTVNADGSNFPTYGRDLTVTPSPGQPPAIDGSSAIASSPTTAVLSAEINPNFASTIYRIQYGATNSYGAQTAPSETIGEGGTPHQISTELSNLEPATTYHFRVVAVNFSGVTAGLDGTFTTPGTPTVSAGSAVDITPTSAILSAGIRPGYRATTYHFEYGPTVGYGARTSESQSVGSDDSIHSVSSSVSGLSPLTTYHFRVVATNAIGISDGPDQTFTTTVMSAITPKPVTCRAGFVKKRGKCVREHHRTRKSHRRSN